jgi:hypothetical protein
MLKQYWEYINDNPKNLWFKRKLYGWGWVPVSWQGRLTILAFVTFQIWNFFRLDVVSHSNSDTLRPFLIQTLFATIILIAICYWKGETPAWQWGNKK